MTTSAAPAQGIAFLHRLDSVRGDELVVGTTAARLRQASFLDGRESFWSSETLRPLELRDRGPRAATRFIFHVGFCGSTLLARLLDNGGDVLALKEPQCLADIASQRVALATGSAAAPLPAAIDHALEWLGASAGEDGFVVVKPTNWVNTIVADLCAPDRPVHAVFVSMERRAYLGAIFRGGRARIAFCMRLAGEVASASGHGDDVLESAIRSSSDPLDQAARACAVLHAQQEALFDRAIVANGWSADVKVSFAELLSDRVAVVGRVSRVLDLPSRDRAADVPAIPHHAKDPSAGFKPEERAVEDAQIEAHHGPRFDAALAWLERTGGSL
jgi:hypothetical protein